MRGCLLLIFTLLLLAGCDGYQGRNTPLQPQAGISLDSLVHRVAIPSPAMQAVYNAYVLLPESYYLDSTARRYPTVYLLHGHGGQYTNWYDRMPELREYASEYEMIIVMPEGLNSWYIDAPADSTVRFETYIGATVPAYIEANFRAEAKREARAITGNSMGGHGALYLALLHLNWYGAAGSMSGVVDLRPYAQRWDLPLRLGDPEEEQERYASYSVINNLPKRAAGAPELIIDCGTEDELLGVNRQLHEALLANGVAHTYTEYPGGHDWAYWRQAMVYQLLFFDRYFAGRGL